MKGHESRSGRETWERLRREVRVLAASEQGRKAAWFFGLLVVCLVASNGLNVVNSYVGRDFISALADRDASRFIAQAWRYVAVFALSTVTAVVSRYLEERLGLLWREWQTRRLIARYLAHRAYYRIEERRALENPDQRIAEDVRSFTTTTLSFVLMTLNAGITILAFSGVLWSISPRLFLVAVIYALCGSLFTVLLGRRLVGLNNAQLDREADFRSELLYLRENAEAVALLHREGHSERRLGRRFGELVANMRRIIAVHFKLGFFTNGYNYLIQIIPALIVAPLYLRGEVEFGVITQSAMAFSTLMGAFSLAVTQFESISGYAAVVSRLSRLVDAIERNGAQVHSALELRAAADRIAFEKLTLYGEEDGRVLVRELSVTIPRGTRTLIAALSGHAKIALFRAVAGLHTEGAGAIRRPDPDGLLFIPERPALPHGSLRELLLPDGAERRPGDAEIMEVLRELHLEALAAQAGGLDAERHWSSVFGLREQALLVIARILLARPAFVFLDRTSLALDAADTAHVLERLTARGITYLKLGRPDEPTASFDAVLEIAGDGSWRWRTLAKAA
ncbi:MAG: ABC transporter ATP-binding protein/permease [Nevskia sp.]|nr:ABC transporter ATP-binding protein/permease [Nevskia sp.]